MITYVRLRISPSRNSEFIRSFEKMVKELNVSNICEAAELTQCQSETENYILRVKWKSSDSKKLTALKSKADKYLETILRYKDDILEMRNYTSVF